MAWKEIDVIPAGTYFRALVDNETGVTFDPFGTLSAGAMESRIREMASGYEVVSVVWERGLFGISERVAVYGRVTETKTAAEMAVSVAAALNSFWTVAGRRVTVSVSDGSAIVLPETGEGLSKTIQLVAVAVIAFSLVWGIRQFR